MKIDDEISKKIKECTGRNVEVYKGMGFDAIREKTSKKIDVTLLRNGKLTETQLRHVANEKDANDPKNASLFADRKNCKNCGAELSFDEIQRGHRTCKNCSNEKAKNKILQEANVVEAQTVASTTIAAPTSFTLPKVKLMDEKEALEFNKQMCHVATVRDLMQHAPDRAVVFINIENYSPTINMYTEK